MPERVYLSLWIRGFDERNMLSHFGRLLERFPYSRLRPGIDALRVYAFEDSEPPALEHLFSGPPDAEAVLRLAREFEHADCAYLVEGWWELWQFSGDWKLAPSRVTLCCYGPAFDNPAGNHLRVELPSESDFTPVAGLRDSVRRMESNLQGLLRLAHELEEALPLERRRVWTESGEDLAARLSGE